MVAMFYKVNANTELANTEPLLLGGYWVRVLQGLATSHQPISNLALCVFLLKATLFDTYC